MNTDYSPLPQNRSTRHQPKKDNAIIFCIRIAEQCTSYLSPDISGTWGSAFEADNSGWQSTGAVYSAKTGSLSMEIPDFSETREFIHRSFRASRYSGYYGASGVSVDAAYSLMIIRT